MSIAMETGPFLTGKSTLQNMVISLLPVPQEREPGWFALTAMSPGPHTYSVIYFLGGETDGWSQSTSFLVRSHV